jgi:hypothetical protein
MLPEEYVLYSTLTSDEVVMLSSHLHEVGLIKTALCYFEQLPELSHAEIVVSLASKTGHDWMILTDKLLKVPLYTVRGGFSTEPSVDIEGQPLPLPIEHRAVDVPLLGKIPVRKALNLAQTRKKDTRIITYVCPKNPKVPGGESYRRFQLYEVGMTVSEFVSKGGRYDDIKYDLKKGYIEVSL